MWRPELVGSVGGTFAVLGEPSEGGASASLAAMWPVTERLSFGVMVHGDDAGSTVDSLRDESGAGLAFGTVQQAHRAAWGVSWRLDAHGASAVRADAVRERDLGRVPRRRRRDAARPSATWAPPAGAWPGACAATSGGTSCLGAYARYHRLFNDVEGRFMSAGLEGIWR